MPRLRLWWQECLARALQTATRISATLSRTDSTHSGPPRRVLAFGRNMAIALIGLGNSSRAAARRICDQLPAENPSRSHEARPHCNGTQVEFIGDLRWGFVVEDPGHDVL